MAAEEPGKITDLKNLPENVSLISVGNGLYRMIDTEDLKRLSRIRWSLEMENKQEDYRLIPLTQGKFAIVDAEDYDWLSKYKWCAWKNENAFYACRTEKGHTVFMHRMIMSAPKGLMCDHIDHNGLNNRKSNLRLCTPAQNVHNKRPQRDSSSKYKGVGSKKQSRKWEARIRFQGKLYHLGDFDNQMEAAMAYDDKAAELFGEFAYLNFPERRELRNWIRKIIWAA